MVGMSMIVAPFAMAIGAADMALLICPHHGSRFAAAFCRLRGAAADWLYTYR
jgi:hypothetical protein